MASEGVEFEPGRGVSHVCVKTGVSHFAVTLDNPWERMGELFQALADANVSVYLVKLHPDDNVVDFAVHAEQGDAAEQVLKDWGASYEPRRGFHLVSLVAPAMRDLSGIVVRIITALNEKGIPVHELADSYNSVSCLLSPDDSKRAAQALSEEFDVPIRDPGPLDPW